MIIGRVTEVDTVRRVITVLAYGRDDDFVLRDVHVVNTVGQISSTPAVGDKVLVNNEGKDSFLIGTLPEISEAAEAENEKEDMLPGEAVIGTREQGVGLLRGGLAFLLANPATGIMAIDQMGGVLNILGNKIYTDSSLYHKEIVTEELGVKVKESIAGNATIEHKSDTTLGQIETKLDNLVSLKVDINQGIATLVSGTIDLKIKTLTGNVSLKLDPAGNLTISGVKIMKIEAERAGINSDTIDPLDGIITGKSKCFYTKGPHIDCSKTVFAGR